MIILKAVVSDPLHRWAPTMDNALKRQKSLENLEGLGGHDDNEESYQVSGDAERVLLRVRQKLQGYEDPDGDALAVPGQVDRLIREAIDENNLCLMFAGW
jgi:ataxia telangiectasia mutated family protein